MLATGDRHEVARAVAAGLSIDQVRSELTPDQKILVVLSERKNGPVMMIGDGVNDAPALAAADIGIAMGAKGAAASAEAADVVLLVDQLDRVLPAIRIARRSRRIALESVIAGMGLSIVAMVAAAYGYLPPVEGALLQEVIDVAVIFNALRALRGDDSAGRRGLNPGAMTEAGPADIATLDAALTRMGLIAPGEQARYTALTGGVASDIWKVDTPAKTFAIKRALPKLKVAADWYVPVARNAYEVKWMEVVRGILPQAVPQLLGHDPAAGLFAMAYLDPDDLPNWKSELRDGRTDDAFAAEVGRRLVRIHAATAKDPAIAAAFATDETFHAIRLAAYLEATAPKHPQAAEALMALSRATLATKLTLVHGDVSPKNILVGPDGPVFLDAECAWYGDPAFDLAFCLNHMLLKCLWTPRAAARFLELFDVLVAQLSRRRHLGAAGSDGGAHRAPAARIVPRPRRRQVAGRIRHRGSRQGADSPRGAERFFGEPPQRLSDIRNAWAREIGIKEPAA